MKFAQLTILPKVLVGTSSHAGLVTFICNKLNNVLVLKFCVYLLVDWDEMKER